MPQNKKMTDRHQARLYFGLVHDYQKYTAFQNPPMTTQQIYDALYYGVYSSLNDPKSELYGLLPDEQMKAYTILNTFFTATWQYRDNNRLRILYIHNTMPQLPSVSHEHVVIIQQQRYCCHNDVMFKFWLWSTLVNYSRPRYVGTSSNNSFNMHRHPMANRNNSGESIALLILVVISAIALGLAFIAFYYLLRESVNNVERMACREGHWQALISFFSLLVCGAVCAMLASAFAVNALAGLAFAIGFSNPFGVILVGIILLTILGAAAGCFITNQIQRHVLKTSNPDALDPTDPKRFELSDSEAKNLLSEGIDPIKVKCVILALRAEIGDKPVPPLLGSPWNSRSREVQSALNQIRDLRCGKGPWIVKIREMHFDCHVDKTIDDESTSAQSSLAVVRFDKRTPPSPRFNFTPLPIEAPEDSLYLTSSPY